MKRYNKIAVMALVASTSAAAQTLSVDDVQLVFKAPAGFVHRPGHYSYGEQSRKKSESFTLPSREDSSFPMYPELQVATDEGCGSGEVEMDVLSGPEKTSLPFGTATSTVYFLSGIADGLTPTANGQWAGTSWTIELIERDIAFSYKGTCFKCSLTTAAQEYEQYKTALVELCESIVPINR